MKEKKTDWSVSWELDKRTTKRVRDIYQSWDLEEQKATEAYFRTLYFPKVGDLLRTSIGSDYSAMMMLLNLEPTSESVLNHQYAHVWVMSATDPSNRRYLLLGKRYLAIPSGVQLDGKEWELISRCAL